MNKAKQPSWDKVLWQIVESLLFNTLVASYKVHFVAYCIDKKHVSQLILATSTMWKAIYLHYLKAYPKAPFVEETPKDHLWETFKELKTCNSNEEGSKQAHDLKILKAEELNPRTLTLKL